MSYASDRGLTVGSKIKVIGDGVGCCFSDGDIIELVEDDGQTNPYFRGGGSPNRKAFSLDRYKWEHYKEEGEAMAKLKFPCCVATSEIKDEETFKKIFDLFVTNGALISEGDYAWGIKDFSYYGVDGNSYTKFWDWPSTYVVGKNDVTVYTLEQLLDFLPKEEATTAQVTALLPVGTEVKIAKDSEWYKDNDRGNPKDTKGSVIRSRPEDIDDFCYRVEWDDGTANTYRLNDLVLWEDTPSVASQEAITERLEDNPSVGIDYSVIGSTASTEPLITITQEVKYTVVIKGVTFTFTQEEIDGLAEELLGFTTL